MKPIMDCVIERELVTIRALLVEAPNKAGRRLVALFRLVERNEGDASLEALASMLPLVRAVSAALEPFAREECRDAPSVAQLAEWFA